MTERKHMRKVKRSIEDYKDILHRPRHISDKRAKMAIEDRAAQFSPFAAVVGHEAAVKEAARYVDAKKELDEMEKAVIDEKLRDIEARILDAPDVEVVYFEPDVMKAGGHYLTKVGSVKKLDTYSKEILFTDETRISVEEVYSIEFIN